jgi:hypothetical protein
MMVIGDKKIEAINARNVMPSFPAKIGGQIWKVYASPHYHCLPSLFMEREAFL